MRIKPSCGPLGERRERDFGVIRANLHERPSYIDDHMVHYLLRRATEIIATSVLLAAEPFIADGGQVCRVALLLFDEDTWWEALALIIDDLTHQAFYTSRDLSASDETGLTLTRVVDGAVHTVRFIGVTLLED